MHTLKVVRSETNYLLLLRLSLNIWYTGYKTYLSFFFVLKKQYVFFHQSRTISDLRVGCPFFQLFCFSSFCSPREKKRYPTTLYLHQWFLYISTFMFLPSLIFFSFLIEMTLSRLQQRSNVEIKLDILIRGKCKVLFFSSFYFLEFLLFFNLKRRRRWHATSW